MRAQVFIGIVCSCLIGCMAPQVKNSTEGNELEAFAKVNCLYWYFKKKGYDTNDIQAIAGGVVEMSESSAESFQNIALFVKDYQPDIKSKANVDVDLYKCFKLDDSEELRSLIKAQ
ncbi:MAG: hypothetical protein CSH37_12740 [Thalassolituus sp.]|nr:MAG: hypothetical protein CSH37_12740 [Thalassolituus sp.]